MVMVMGVTLGPLVMVMGGRLTSPTGHGHGGRLTSPWSWSWSWGEVNLPHWSWSWGEVNLPPFFLRGSTHGATWSNGRHQNPRGCDG
jgi:hypothetical protein